MKFKQAAPGLVQPAVFFYYASKMAAAFPQPTYKSK